MPKTIQTVASNKQPLETSCWNDAKHVDFIEHYCRANQRILREHPFQLPEGVLSQRVFVKARSHRLAKMVVMPTTYQRPTLGKLLTASSIAARLCSAVFTIATASL